MKLFMLILMCCGAMGLWSEELLTYSEFVNNFKKTFKTPAFSMNNEVLEIRGVPHKGEKINGNQKMFVPLNRLEMKNCPHAEIILEFEAKVKKNSGRVEVCVREVDAAKKSLSYHRTLFGKYDKFTEWKKFRKHIKFSPQAAQAYFFIWARFLAADDDISLRNIKITKL